MCILKSSRENTFSCVKRTMLSYCLKCKKDMKNINPKTLKTSNGKIILSSRFAECNRKRSRFSKEQEASELVSNLGIKPPLKLVSVIFCFLIKQ